MQHPWTLLILTLLIVALSGMVGAMVQFKWICRRNRRMAENISLRHERMEDIGRKIEALLDPAKAGH